MLPTPRLIVSAQAEAEFTEKRSRFIGRVLPIRDETEAGQALERARLDYKAASHYCYAWICGEQDQYQRSADAGEPAGTAGRPILEALKRAGLHDAMIIVVRYFGGVLLGAGGLTRAYGRAANLAIAQARLARLVPGRRVAISFDYTQVGKVENCLASLSIEVENRVYGQQVCCICAVETSRADLVRRSLAELSGGSLLWQDLGEDISLSQPV